MSVSTTINGVGVVSLNNGSGLVVSNDTGNSGFGPWATGISAAITSITTMSIGGAGVSTLSSSTAVPVQVLMPDPSTCAGAEFVFRNLSAHAHVISGSTAIFATTGSTGARLALPATVGASVFLKSDGLQFMYLGGRGTPTLT